MIDTILNTEYKLEKRNGRNLDEIPDMALGIDSTKLINMKFSSDPNNKYDPMNKVSFEDIREYLKTIDA